jgi:hypothetical protein
MLGEADGVLPPSTGSKNSNTNHRKTTFGLNNIILNRFIPFFYSLKGY